MGEKWFALWEYFAIMLNNVSEWRGGGEEEEWKELKSQNNKILIYGQSFEDVNILIAGWVERS